MTHRVTIFMAGVVFVATSGAASAQLLYRPTPSPTVSAVNEEWFLRGEPILVNGFTYHRGGPPVFFDGDLMVAVGWYGGVPVYADTTIEPNSIVLVPIGRGLLQPYERRREEDLAGTTGSRVPSYPVVQPQAGVETSFAGMSGGVGQAAAPPMVGSPLLRTIPQVPVDGRAVSPLMRMMPQTPAPPPVLPPGAPAVSAADVSASVGTTGREATIGSPRVQDSRRAPSRLEVWIEYEGARFAPAGFSEPLDTETFVPAGDYAGYPVYRRRDGGGDRIYLPAGPDRVSPYEPVR